MITFIERENNNLLKDFLFNPASPDIRLKKDPPEEYSLLTQQLDRLPLHQDERRRDRQGQPEQAPPRPRPRRAPVLDQTRQAVRQQDPPQRRLRVRPRQATRPHRRPPRPAPRQEALARAPVARLQSRAVQGVHQQREEPGGREVPAERAEDRHQRLLRPGDSRRGEPPHEAHLGRHFEGRGHLRLPAEDCSVLRRRHRTHAHRTERARQRKPERSC